MHATLSEIEQVVVSEGIDCDFERGGTITVYDQPRAVSKAESIDSANAGVGF